MEALEDAAPPPFICERKTKREARESARPTSFPFAFLILDSDRLNHLVEPILCREIELDPQKDLQNVLAISMGLR
jgi:hypothetical protein